MGFNYVALHCIAGLCDVHLHCGLLRPLSTTKLRDPINGLTEEALVFNHDFGSPRLGISEERESR
jgi:hypothetical protein